MYVITYGSQITIAASVHDQGLVATAEKMAEELVPPIEPARVRSEKPFHARHQICLGGFHHQMKMIDHQAVGVNLPAGFCAHFTQSLEEPLPVPVVLENRLPPIPAVHYMIN